MNCVDMPARLKSDQKQVIKFINLQQLRSDIMGNTCCQADVSIQKEKDDFIDVLDEVLIGNEPLCEVSQDQMKQRLHKYQTAIICKYMSSVIWGSGILISKNLVLTTAHNLFKNRMRMSESDYYIYPGHAGGSLQKAYKIDKMHINSNFQKAFGKQTIRFDYALIKLTEEVAIDEDFICLKPDLDGRDSELGVFGYPAIKYESESISEDTRYKVSQWGRTKKNAVYDIRYQNGEMRHKVSTLAGQSGSPIIEISGEELAIVGIHKGALKYMLEGQEVWINVGRLITKQLINQLKEAALDMKAHMFKIYSENSRIKTVKNMPFYPRASAFQPKPVSDQDKKKAKQQFQAGEKFYLSNEYEKAKERFINATSLNPNSASSCYHLGLTYEYTKQHALSILWYQKAKEIQPRNIKLLNTLAYALEKSQRYKEAVAVYNELLAINRSNITVLMSLGMIHHKCYEFDQAISKYKRIIEINPDFYDAHLSLGCANEAKKEYVEALRCFERCLQIRPNEPKALKKMFELKKKI